MLNTAFEVLGSTVRISSRRSKATPLKDPPNWSALSSHLRKRTTHAPRGRLKMMGKSSRRLHGIVGPRPVCSRYHIVLRATDTYQSVQGLRLRRMLENARLQRHVDTSKVFEPCKRDQQAQFGLHVQTSDQSMVHNPQQRTCERWDSHRRRASGSKPSKFEKLSYSQRFRCALEDIHRRENVCAWREMLPVKYFQAKRFKTHDYGRF